MVVEINSLNIVTNIDKAYLAIDYSNKTELIDTYGNVATYTRPYSELIEFAEKSLTEEIP